MPPVITPSKVGLVDMCVAVVVIDGVIGVGAIWGVLVDMCVVVVVIDGVIGVGVGSGDGVGDM